MQISFYITVDVGAVSLAPFCCLEQILLDNINANWVFN
jgi:hypothetical protein